MNRYRTVIILDDDNDDLELIRQTHNDLQLPNPIVLFCNARELVEYLVVTSVAPLLILSCYRFPEADGIEIMRKIRSNNAIMHRKIPFIIWSTTVTPEIEENCNQQGVDGILPKPKSYEELLEIYAQLLRHWELSI